MLTLDRLRVELVSLPLLTRIGLLILVLGGFADVAAHLEAASHADHLHEHTASELSAHLVAFVVMVVILLGVVVDGLRRTLNGSVPNATAAARDARSASRVLPAPSGGKPHG